MKKMLIGHDINVPRLLENEFQDFSFMAYRIS